MTKEELEKDYYADRPTEPYSDDDSPNDWANIAHYAEENLEKAFKRIAEHEFTNKKISDECHKLVDTLEKKQNENELLETQNIKLQAEVSRLTLKNAELRKTETMLKVLKDRGVIKSWYYNGSYHVGNELPR